NSYPTPLKYQQKLARYAVGDEAAFAALVARHTGLVLGVCRRALPTVQDAEDAAQATFPVLARKARSTSWRPSVANWLYTTARHVCARANRTAQRRSSREAHAAVPASSSPLDQMTGREAFAALDEELDRLPPRYREPLVLCYLEGLTRDEAAARLGVRPATLKSELDRGRKKLSDALTKRGVALGAGLLAVAATSAAGASPSQLVHAVLAAAAGSPAPAVAALAEGVAVNGVLNKSRLAALAAVAVVASGLGFALVSPRAAEPPKPAAEKKSEAPREDQIQRTIAGKVVAADGKPVVAELWANWHGEKPKSLGRTNVDGAFEVTVPLKGLGGWLVAMAPGHGLEHASLRAPSPVTLSLPAAHPIRGRVIDPQGQPVAGLRVTVESMGSYDNSSLEKHLKRWADEFTQGGGAPGYDRGIAFHGSQPDYPDADSLIHATTVADGKFELTGVGTGRQVCMTIRDPGYARMIAYLINRAGFDAKPYLAAATPDPNITFQGRPSRFATLYGPEPRIIVEREKVIRGTVTARDTGKPLVGVRVVVPITGPPAYLMNPGTFTDRNGRYEIRGLYKSDRYTVNCYPDPKTGYFGNTAELRDPPGYEPVVIDLRCASGVIVTGTVRDKVTGAAIDSYVSWQPLPGNAFAAKYSKADIPSFATAKGEFRLVAMPGPIVLITTSDKPVYRSAKPDPKYGDFLSGWPDIKSYVVINPKETDREVHVNIELEPAPKTVVRVVDADGRPVTGAHANTSAARNAEQPVHYSDTDMVPLYNLEPDEARFLSVVHVERRLVGTLMVKAGDKDHVVKLGPGGTVTGRVVGTDGKPAEGMIVRLLVTHIGVGIATKLLDANKERRYDIGGRQVSTDKNGEFRIDALFPGYEFRLFFLKAGKNYGPDHLKAPRHTIARHGETLNLGDLRLEPTQRGPAD
ncbi:MAG: sigma-70 family RNA polymerase sigma factor, partial [Gemmataceae bacterium]